MGKGELREIISSKVHETFKTFEIVTLLISESYHILVKLCDSRNIEGLLPPKNLLPKSSEMD